MKKTITVLFAAGLTVIAVVAGCSNKDMELAYQQALTQSAAQADSIRTLRIMVQSKNDSLIMANESTTAAEARIDSLITRYNKTAGYASNLKKELATLRDDCAQRESELLAGIRERDSVLTEIDALFSDTNVTLASVRTELGDERTRSQWLGDLLNKVKPWYKKWKHDSKRSFLKVLFASGKAKTPDFPEPNLDSITIPTSTTTPMQPAPTDTTKSKDVSMILMPGELR
jgi:hypothetical protein